jgi:PAS domain-containing protein
VNIDQGSWIETAEELYESAPCGYLSTLPDGVIASANRTFLDWVGAERNDLVGRRRFQDFLGIGGRSSTRRILRRCCRCRASSTRSRST